MNQICQLNKARRNFDVNERSAAFHSDRISEDIFSAGTLSIKKWKIQWASQNQQMHEFIRPIWKAVQNCPRFQVFNLCKTGDTK